MARYTTTIRTPWSAERAFDYMADLRNFEKWDPGVRSSRLVAGTEPGLGAAYDVTVTGTELRYKVTEFVRPTRTVAEAESARLRSYDVIDIAPNGSGADVTYDATLELKGLFRVVEPVMRIIFRRIGDKAGAGMARALEGHKIA